MNEIEKKKLRCTSLGGQTRMNVFFSGWHVIRPCFFKNNIANTSIVVARKVAGRSEMRFYRLKIHFWTHTIKISLNHLPTLKSTKEKKNDLNKRKIKIEPNLLLQTYL